MSSHDFRGRRALVTGAGAGIGRALALRLASSGARVVALSRTQGHLDALKQECPSIETLCLDLKCTSAIRAEIRKLGPVQLLVNNAAACSLAPAAEASEEDFDTLFSVNVKAAMVISQEVAKGLFENKLQGSIVNISSQAGQRALKDHLLYGATKAALDHMTKTMALEFGPKGIRVNAVSPTVVMTEMGRLGWSDPAKAGPLLARIPQGRFAEVEEVVSAVCFLLSDASQMVNGHALPVDGGFLAC